MTRKNLKLRILIKYVKDVTNNEAPTQKLHIYANGT